MTAPAARVTTVQTETIAHPIEKPVAAFICLLRVAIGLLRVAISLLRVAIGLLRVAIGLLRVAIGLLRVVMRDFRLAS